MEEEKADSLPDGWDSKVIATTKRIDYEVWQTTHPGRESYFFGPDNYIYTNPSTMKKFVDALKKNEVDEKTVVSAIKPMRKLISTNPNTYFGITGSRYIVNGGGLGVASVFYVAREFVSH